MWAEAFRFCPVDGLPLTEEVHPVPVVTAEDSQKARKGSGRLLDIPPAPAVGPTTDRIAKPGPGAIAGPRTKRQSKQIGPNAATITDTQAARPELHRDPTIVDRAAISPEHSKGPTPGRAPAEAAPDKGRGVRGAPTAPERTPDTGPMERMAIQGKAESESTSRPGKAEKPEKKSRKGFSETAWFMRVVDPNAVDPNTGKVKVDEDAYKRDKALPAEKRKLFSLGSKPADIEEES